MKLKSRKWLGLAAVGFLAVACVMAQEADTLTRAQWLKQIGPSVNDVSILKGTLARVAPEDRVEFTQRILKAVSRMPVGPEEKSAAFVRTAVACIAGIPEETKQRVIAEVFAVIPIEHLPVVTEELARRFDQEYNGLSDERYEKFSVETLKIAVDRNAHCDMPSVRNTFVVLVFLRGSKNSALKNRLVSLLPDERMRNLADGWVGSVMNNNDYEPLLAASDVDALPIRHSAIVRMVGHSLLDRLLAELNQNMQWDAAEGKEGGERLSSDETVWIPLSQLWQIGGSMTTPEGHSADFGINRVPRPLPPIPCCCCPCGYQNQGTTISP